MLYNPNWNTPSLIGLIAWLRMQPAKKTYDFDDCRGDCLFGQYMAHLGISWWEGINPYGETLTAVWPKDYQRAQKIAFDAPRTFGAALRRAEKLAHD